MYNNKLMSYATIKKYSYIKKNTYNLQLGRKAELWGERTENNAKCS